MKRSLSRQIQFGFGLTLLLLLSNAVISYRNLQKLIANERSVSQSHQVIGELEGTLSTLKDAETGQRGYLLTGQEQYLEPYKGAIGQIRDRLRSLKQLSGNSKIQPLEQAIDTKFAELEKTIQIRRAQGLQPALRVVQLNRGKQIMDGIRSQISAIEAEEFQQLEQRTAESQHSLNATLLTFTLVTGTSLLLLALLSILFRRNELQRQHVERGLKKREEIFRSFVKYAPVSVAMFDETMRYLAVSQRWIDTYRLESIDSVLGKSHYEIFPNLPESWKIAHRQGIAGQNLRKDNDRYTLPDGTEQSLRWEIQPWRGGTAIAKGILIFVEDITAQQQTEAALQESEQQFRATFNQAAVGIAHVAPNGAWLRVNQKLCEIVQYPCEELLKKTFQDITHPDDLAIDLTYVRQMLANQIQTYSMEKRYIRKDRSLIWVNLTVALVQETDGQPKYFISVVEDISQRKQAEFDLQHLNETLEQRIAARTEQLIEINQELEAFTYTVSRDLRAPLRIMQGFAQALQEDYGDRLDEVAETYIQSISNSAIQLDDLINDLLAYSRLSRTQIQLQPTDLNEAIDAALEQLSIPIQERNAIVHVPPDLPLVMAHRAILVQVIVNLISNAIKFVEPGIQPIVRISAQIEKNSIRLVFVDNGIGIALKYHDRIFRVFERLHGIEQFPGTGIGLAIVRKGIDRMGGEVGIESQLGQGSQFWIRLPLDLTQFHESDSHSSN